MNYQNFSLLPAALALFSTSHASALLYDYIIVGGGTSGLTLANRLSELPHLSIAIIEAGPSVSNNPNVTDLDKFTLALGTSLDWNYESTPQTYAAGQKVAYHGGKALGGTSTINGMTYIRAEKAQIDAWEDVGNHGWNWDSLLPYYEKSEKFVVPTAAQVEAGAAYDPAYHGEHGPLKVGYSYGMLNGSFVNDVEAGWSTLGIEHNPEANSGHVRGFTVWQSTLDREANVREDAARAYYYPVQGRRNLHLFLNTTANKIIWKDSKDVVASGVEITSANGTIGVLGARKEVILSAGSLRSPALLELSGIGNPTTLKEFGIPLKVSLPGVGENLQDQPLNGIGFQADRIFNGTIGWATFGTLDDLALALPPPSIIASWAANISAAINNALTPSSLTHLLSVQYSLLSHGVPDAESVIQTTLNIGMGATNFVGSPLWLLMPFSRGNVHIVSAEPGAYPAINPNFFLIDFDLQTQIAIAKWTRKLWAAEPLKDIVTEVNPGFTAVPEHASDEVWGEWAKTGFSSNSHPLGTASMMSRDLGGVVDCKLKVYGTQNVRVVDASVMPFQVSGHLTSTLYAIAEKAADLIKEDLRN